MPSPVPTAMWVLIVEDNPGDVRLIVEELRQAGWALQWHTASTSADFERRARSQSYDVVIADYNVGGWTGLDALRSLGRFGIDTPFILFSGTIGEEAAVEVIKEGATDYVRKDNLKRLPLIVERAVNEARTRRERQAMDEALRQSEEQLRQAQRLEAIGRLAGGIAHDFNNLLTVITGYCDLLQERAEGPIRRYAEEIAEASRRAAGLTRQLLAFSRKQILQPVVLNLNSVLTDLAKMLPRLIREDIELIVQTDPRLANVLADKGQMEQVIMNLVVNASDAMPKGGRLTLETMPADVGPDQASTMRGFVPGRYALLRVSDNGLGMDADTLHRAFEPFFTTKPLGRGTGLGLSTVYGIVKQSGGYIHVESAPGKGSAFSIYLPEVQAPVLPARGERAHPQSIQAPQSVHVLIVEDEPSLRELTAGYLRDLGYRVESEGDPRRAIELAAQPGFALDLLITDVIMPHMSGRDLADRVRKGRPVKVLYLSGYTDEVLAPHGILAQEVHFLQKPFGLEDLARKVRDVLGPR